MTTLVNSNVSGGSVNVSPTGARYVSRNTMTAGVVNVLDNALQVDAQGFGYEKIRQTVMNLKFLDDNQPQLLEFAENHLADPDKFTLIDEIFVLLMITG
jgi:hypothetical protein